MSIRHDWTTQEAMAIYQRPFLSLMFEAQTVHRAHFTPNEVQLSTLLNIKTGACKEDCAYCSQSVHHQTDLKTEPLMSVDKVLAHAKRAKAQGASRFCMGAAWSRPSERQLNECIRMVEAVRGLGMDTCLTAGMLTRAQAERLKAAGLGYYNHNLDTSERYYPKIITTRTYQDRLDTLENVRQAGISVCSGGILGLGETLEDRLSLLVTLAQLSPHPESVPINKLVSIEGTPLADATAPEDFEFLRIIALARIMMPASYVRLSAGRDSFSDAVQAWAFMAGANSIHYGDTLLTTSNPAVNKDKAFFHTLGIRATSDAIPSPVHVSEHAS